MCTGELWDSPSDCITDGARIRRAWEVVESEVTFCWMMYGLLLMKKICWCCCLRSSLVWVVLSTICWGESLVAEAWNTTDWRAGVGAFGTGSKLVVSVQFFNPVDVTIDSLRFIVDGGDVTAMGFCCCVWAFWKRWLTMALESDEAPEASAERRKFVVDGSLKSIINAWDGSVGCCSCWWLRTWFGAYSSWFGEAVDDAVAAGAIAFVDGLARISWFELVVPIKEITSIWFDADDVRHGFWAAAGERTKSGLRALTFRVT